MYPTKYFTDIDECNSDPCVNSCTCSDGDNSYTCSKDQAGYTGEQCETSEWKISYKTNSISWSYSNFVSYILLTIYIDKGFLLIIYTFFIDKQNQQLDYT